MRLRGTWNLARELGAFLLTNKRWWLAPILLAIVLVSLFIVATQSPLGPLIYTLF